MKDKILVYLGILIMGYFLSGCGKLPFDADSAVLRLSNIPKFVEHDFVNLDMIQSISKFRSGAGHDFSDGFEGNESSMKHYYHYYYKYSGTDTTIPVYSPVDGIVVAKRHERAGRSNDYQVHIIPVDHTYITIIIFHLNSRVKRGERVQACEQIGYVQAEPTPADKADGDTGGHDFDIAVEARTFTGTHLISYFEIMSDKLFKNYVAHGAKSRGEFIISKEWRAAHPVDWQNPDTNDWVNLIDKQ